MDSIDRIFAESVRKAIMDFGEDIILERRLIGILKDYQGFSTLLPAELITRVLIESGAIRRLQYHKKNNRTIIDKLLQREVVNLEVQFGFSEKYTRKTLLSILHGMGARPASGHANRDSISKQQKQSAEKSGIELTKKESTVQVSNLDILDIRKIPTGKTYLELREEFCKMTKGVMLTDYKTKDGNKHALFSCDIPPYRKVEVKITSGNNFDQPTLIQATLINRLNKDFSAISDEATRITSILDKLYASEKTWEPLDDTDLTNATLKDDFKMAKKSDQDHLLQHYYLKEGYVSCKLHVYHNGWSIVVYLRPTESKISDTNAWPLPQTPHFPIPPHHPAYYDNDDSCLSEYYDWEDADDEDEEEEDFDDVDYEEDEDEYDEDEYDEDDVWDNNWLIFSM